MESGSVAGELARGGARRLSVASALRVQTRDVVRVTREFDLPPERVFDAWLDPTIAGNWLFATASRPMTRVDIDPRVGGAFRFLGRNWGRNIEHTGIYVEIVRPRRLVFTLCLENDPSVVTRVAAKIAPLPSGCELTLIHENVPPDHAHFIEGRWSGMLYGLAEKLEATVAG